jgi:uncharacterized coiled-coil protein SlyX
MERKEIQKAYRARKKEEEEEREKYIEELEALTAFQAQTIRDTDAVLLQLRAEVAGYRAALQAYQQNANP